MAKYLDEAGLSTLWKKIKGTFVAQIIKKSDSSNATQITHNGDTVSLSRGTISGTGNTSTYTASTSIDIGVDDIITFTSTSRPQYRVDKNSDLIAMAFLRDIPKVDIALSSDSTNPVQNKVITSALNGKSNTGHTHSYTDLTDKPTIGNAQITIRQNGTEKGSFTLNQTSAKIIDLIDTTYDIATQSAPGLMSKDDKNKLDRIETGANKTIVDTALDASSTNPVQNKVIFTALNNKLNTSDFNAMKGVTNGLATLDSTGKVPSSQLPSYVDDVIEGYYYNSKFYKEESHTNEITGESGKIYTDLDKNKTYRWSGTIYTEISASLALGTTSSTAYPGNLGAANAANITTLQSDLASVAQNASAKIDKSILTTKGDIIYASAANTPTRLGIGANGKVLKVVSGVPAWSDDNNTTYSAGNGISLNGTTFSLNTNYENNGRSYAVLVDNNKNLYVNVPWNDTNTTYSAGTGLSLSGTTFSVKTGYSANGKNYAVKADTNGNLYVNVPWVNTTDHSHSNKALLDNFEGAISVDDINALS